MANKIIAVLIGVATVIFLIIGPMMMVGFSHSVYKPFYSENFKTSAADQEFLTNSVLDYIRGFDVAMVPFSPAEIAHLDDVQVLVSVAEILFVVSIVLLLFLIPVVWWYKDNKKLVLKPIFVGSGISLILVTLISIISQLNFSDSFVGFHRMFFPIGNWEFASTDLLILLFPLELFQSLVSRIITDSVSLSVILLAGSYLVLYHFNKKY